MDLDFLLKMFKGNFDDIQLAVAFYKQLSEEQQKEFYEKYQEDFKKFIDAFDKDGK